MWTANFLGVAFARDTPPGDRRTLQAVGPFNQLEGSLHLQAGQAAKQIALRKLETSVDHSAGSVARRPDLWWGVLLARVVIRPQSVPHGRRLSRGEAARPVAGSRRLSRLHGAGHVAAPAVSCGDTSGHPDSEASGLSAPRSRRASSGSHKRPRADLPLAVGNTALGRC